MKRVPIVAVQGGLGNQLFQWFYAHGLLNTPNFNLYTKYPKGASVNLMREFGLAPLVENCSHISRIFEEPDRPTKVDLIPQVLDRIWRVKMLARPLRALGFFQGDFATSSKMQKSRPGRIIYVNGYFQNWIFPNKQQQWVEAELLPVLKDLSSELSKKHGLSGSYTVIHVRRGDYRPDNNPLAWMGCLADEFFIRCAKEHSSNRIILLAEHREEVQELVAALQPHLVLDSKSTTPWETLAIMSLATTFIGSNSSLSWWGAWVASISGASTYLPSRWDVKGLFNSADFLFPKCNPYSPIWES